MRSSKKTPVERPSERTLPARQDATRDILGTHAAAADADPDDLPPGTIVGEYTIEEKAGQGGMATVYSAVHPVIGKRAAVKVMSALLSADGSLVERFVQEARAVNQIGHPSIVDVFAFGRLPDGRCYSVMEWLSGETLYDRQLRRRVTFAELIDIVQQMCDALEAGHDQGIVHRDLKPGNVFLVPVQGKSELVKLLDFGLAKLTGVRDLGECHTGSGTLMGTPEYMSPEQAKARGVDHRTDVYSLGVMAYEMAVGRLPFVAETSMEMVGMHLREAPPPPSRLWAEIPPDLERLLFQMLEKEPGSRPALSEVRERLEAMRGLVPEPPGRVSASDQVLRAALPTHTPLPGSRVRRAMRRLGRRSIIAAGAAVVVLAVVATLGMGGRGVRYQAPAAAATERSSVAASVAIPPPPPVAPLGLGPGTLEVTISDLRGRRCAARIELDGKVVAAQAVAVKLVVAEGGHHELAVTAPGYVPYRHSVAVAPGVTAVVAVSLQQVGSAIRKGEGRGRGDYVINPFGGGR
jgi:serine/threonine protein kinase